MTKHDMGSGRPLVSLNSILVTAKDHGITDFKKYIDTTKEIPEYIRNLNF